MALNDSNWSYLRNVFDNVTSKNNKRMYILSTDHRDKLFEKSTTIPEINALYLIMQPAYEQFADAYSEASKNFTAYKVATSEFEAHLSALSSSHIQSWDIAIQYLLSGDVAAHQMLLPKGRVPFQSGAYDERIKAVRDLADAMVAYPTLSTLLTQVVAFRDSLTAARVAQQGKEANDTLSRQQLEVARENLAVTMHRIFGHLIALYAGQPAIIEAYYELKYLKSATPKPNPNPPIPINANSRQQAMEGLFVSTDNFELENTGENALGFFITEDELNPTPEDVTVLQSHVKRVFTTSELSDNTSPRKLLVVNLNNKTGKFKARLVQRE